jgi:tape measure domain-containing protein
MSNNDLQTTVVLTGDAAQYIAEMEASRQVSLRAFGAIRDSVTTAEQALATAQAEAQQLGQAFATTEQPTKAMAVAFEVARANVARLKTALDEKRQALSQSRAALQASAQAITQETAAQKAAATEAERLAAAERAAAGARTLGVRSIKDMEAELHQLQAALAEVRLSDMTSADKARAIAAFGTRLEALRAEATATGGALSAAFNTLNVRPLSTITAEVERLRAAYASLKDGGASMADLARAKAALTARMSELNIEAGKGVGFFGRLDSAAGSLGLSLRGIGAAIIGKQFIDANLQAERLAKSLVAIEGDARKAGGDLAFLKDVSARLGLDLQSASRGFVSIAAAAKGTAAEGQVSRDIFEAIAGAMSKLGRSSEDTERAFVAIGQMMSKGTVSAEELKGQLGDALPGAFQIAARSVGLTTEQFGKLMETGGIIATSFLPRFAAEVTKTFGATQQQATGLEAAWNRVRNAWSATLATAGDAGLIAAITTLLEGLLKVASGVAVAFGVLGKSIGAVAGAIATGNFSMLGDELRRIGEEANRSYAGVAKAGEGYKAAAADAAQSSRQIATAATIAADAQARLATTTTAAAQAASSAAPTWESLKFAYSELLQQAGKNADQVALTAKANEAGIASAVRLAEITGSETRVIQARAQAAQVAADGSKQLADAKRQEATVANALTVALQQEADAEFALTGKVNQAKVDQIKTTRDAAAAKSEEARQSEALAESTRLEALAAQVAAQTHGDQVQQLFALRGQYDAARGALQTLTEAQKANSAETARLALEAKAAADAIDLTKRQIDAGVASTYDLQVATAVAEEAARKLANAEFQGAEIKVKLKAATEDEAASLARYRDAMDEAIARTERKIRLDQQRADIAQKGIDIDLQLAKNEEALARIKGDEAAAREANIRAMELEAQKAAAAADASAREAETLREKARLKEEAAKKTGELTDETKAEIESIRNAAAAKDMDAQASDVAADGLLRQAKATREADKALRDLNESMKRYDKEGFALNTAGKRVEQSLTDDQLRAAANNINQTAGQRLAWQAILAQREREISAELDTKRRESAKSSSDEYARKIEQDRATAEQDAQALREQSINAAKAPQRAKQTDYSGDTQAAAPRLRNDSGVSQKADAKSLHVIQFEAPGVDPVTVSALTAADVNRILAILQRAGARVGRRK